MRISLKRLLITSICYRISLLLFFSISPKVLPNPLEDLIPVSSSTLTSRSLPKAAETPRSAKEEFQQIKREFEELEQLKQTLSNNFEKYHQLIEQEKQGIKIDKQIIPVLEEIIANLQELEKIYTLSEQEELELLQKFQQVKNNIGEFEQKLTEKFPPET